ncbi:MAG: hypothetical protein US48_C0008G0004 [Candidatus Levybacteria bacterium GW2011_GWA2_37_36]|nr:MAG: hypothetical protein US43_C0015G0010 [Candidatus Levybacteria bacterium GW2011_GWA1_37_16]KKQ33865.1 MAG: hypothetical protein US48_C0008G0004 [Candidatus Levybacteria bacterium GW2011_GWA2_37_36]KKQ38633.1 MAG: hypothetical protein US55_C0003G0013 [Candidatus Levybacteria bacterium GW2011_GWC2_37_7]KKQ42414.1 MAG: hypothetical protein US59_C0009G0010 [Candidatus Levybacteria bacterium GW2011_GWB1_37_8]OGH50072.1 MAG: hypothetical protein A3H17_02495 [Candidatus Levybacteria bacterium R
MDKNKTAQEPIIANPKISQNIESMSSIFTKNLFIFLIVAAILGGITGYVLSFNKGGRGIGNTLTSGSVDSSKITKGTIVGSNDTKTFKDTATGTFKNGGINGEGQFHLVRAGGDSQNVYVTSSSVDLSKFVDKKIKVWGQTQTAQYAGWLMDVGRVEVLE